jgi:hypothetical protein
VSAGVVEDAGVPVPANAVAHVMEKKDNKVVESRWEGMRIIAHQCTPLISLLARAAKSAFPARTLGSEEQANHPWTSL